MKITVISLDNWGYNNHICEILKQRGHVVNHIDFNLFTYRYPNMFIKIYNFFLKLILKKNLKTRYFGKKIIKKLKEIGEIQDVIFTIKGDFIDPKSVLEIKKYGKKSIAFFNDNIYRCPKIIHVIPYFDQVFSFEKKDCERYNLKFATNWIYNSIKQITHNNIFDYEVFNISSKDKRLPTLSKIASLLKSKNINFKIMVFDKTFKGKRGNIDYTSKYISLSEVSDYINRSRTLLDINRKGQQGLTFRVFESLGLQKKLITTNSDIKNYDFYNANNILVIDEENPVIPMNFFETEYENPSEQLLKKYTLDGWIDSIIFNKEL